MRRRYCIAIGVGFGLLVVGCIVGMVTTPIFVLEEYDIRYTLPTVCTGENYGIDTLECSYETCTTGNTDDRQDCTTHYYTCYAYEVWVSYTAVGTTGERVRTSITGGNYAYYSDAESAAMTYMGPHDCFYDTTNLERIRYTEPNPLPAMVAMIIGWGLVGIDLVMFSVVYIWKVFVIGDSKCPSGGNKDIAIEFVLAAPAAQQQHAM